MKDPFDKRTTHFLAPAEMGKLGQMVRTQCGLNPFYRPVPHPYLATVTKERKRPLAVSYNWRDVTCLRCRRRG